ncbi:hypothetical protein EHQ81_05790 [Leptospira selangorensis]|uniref:Zinc ribbon domain-containing protein n=1 Tax=Leptospira selangorensis TaxID=2484982 RepID=A0A5F2BZB8_9LEPT|nr:hypothetical protein [Leptospira selangorensis]TGM15904.1 hypothetical protein EHQ81_05790 [Leptospira selangorensis]TGM18146.1 hypothetical protein EHQ82_13915 [Leptospira selangorensis]
MSEAAEVSKKNFYCRNCGSSILSDSEKCLFCGSYQLPGRIPFFKFLSESRLFRTAFFFPFSALIAFAFPIVHALNPIPFLDWSWILLISFFFFTFSIFGFVSEWIFLNKFKGDAKDFREGFFEWQKTLYLRNPYLSYFGMFLFVCVPLLNWENHFSFAASSSAIWTLLLVFLSKILIPLF